jgi:hypothetical protein
MTKPMYKKLMHFDVAQAERIMEFGTARGIKSSTAAIRQLVDLGLEHAKAAQQKAAA